MFSPTWIYKFNTKIKIPIQQQQQPTLTKASLCFPNALPSNLFDNFNFAESVEDWHGMTLFGGRVSSENELLGDPRNGDKCLKAAALLAYCYIPY